METCNHCGGRMIIVAAITDPVSIKRYLDGVGLPSEIPEINMAVIMRSEMDFKSM
ncbi:MAG: hypothetical protein GY854_06220 [Deltaproteobacteria bacterium]|nr:hypothetical protein [Deltaproteobacteria bacterium]